MIPDHVDRVLAWAAGAHLIVALVCAVAIVAAPGASPILGVHPALKPLKFGVSIALFLGTMAFVVPMLSIGAAPRLAIAITLSATMAFEMLPIALQAARGTTSHFNQDGQANAALWRLMLIAVLIMTVVMIAVALVASLRPLIGLHAQPLDGLAATAWRAALWLFLLAALSGFAMGGRGRHSVAGSDGGPGLPVVNWSVQHGDLRVSHFIAMHALQTIPVAAALLRMGPTSMALRWALLVLVVGAQCAVVIWTWLQALGGRPLWP